MNAGENGSSRGSQRDLVLLAILAGALACRVYWAALGPLLPDEKRTYIPGADAISLHPADLRLPIRQSQHAALPYYLIRAGSLLFGQNRFGYRFVSLAMGMATIWLVNRMALSCGGRSAARWAALLIAVNEYHIAASSMALELSPHLFFAGLGMIGCMRFLETERPAWLYLAGASIGLGFLCREVICLMLPVFLVALLLSPQRRWLCRREPWLAAGLFVLVILPDLLYTLVASPAEKPATYADYADHFSRIAGLGFNRYPSLFFLRDVLRLVGAEFGADFGEMPTMNLLAGTVLLAGSVLGLVRGVGGARAVFLGLMFWGIYGFFTLHVLGRTSRGNALDVAVFHSVRRDLAPRFRAGRHHTGKALGAKTHRGGGRCRADSRLRVSSVQVPVAVER